MRQVEIQSTDHTLNPNFGQVICFKDVEMPLEPLIWPFLKIEAIGDFHEQIGLIVVPLFLYTKGVFVGDKKANFTLA